MPHRLQTNLFAMASFHTGESTKCFNGCQSGRAIQPFIPAMNGQGFLARFL
ncbi:hypothetical protein [Dictyobacter arantiisoli]|uniref:hypothetical protein n=1 Tax=Dictyobacter arantiisoli TaxID=2014874 RepID=UPI00155A72BD|nr:hypothetical protein [Dictyobacter arantiisoli]